MDQLSSHLLSAPHGLVMLGTERLAHCQAVDRTYNFAGPPRGPPGNSIKTKASGQGKGDRT
uniref:Uncharacterized protein n=1 Tax=Ralstonia solanacearum TaxID=305 RepID=A0A0S4WE03_RALSL|nr:protein of unknown function [Ralstonia solanacearum]